ncbi:MAG: methanogenesis marker 14 protein, partial [Methanomicrobiales archaeon]|nr:methanogenesis marker 14 protein [Methanomicrobiales archaeon]
MPPRFLDRFFKPQPHIVESPRPPSIAHGAGMHIPEYKVKPYFLVASVEMGNTTTKCILTGTSLETGQAYLINKTVRMSRDVRKPKPGEDIFGETIDGTQITRQSVTELVREILLECHREVHLDIVKDLDFAVR